MEQSPPLGQRPRLLLQGRAAAFRLSPFEIITILAVAGVAAFAGFRAYAGATDLNATPPAAPTYLPAFRTTLTSSVSATGSVQSSQQVTLTFGSTGKIRELLAGLGADVTAGQPLARLDDSDLQQAVRSAETSLASAQARYNAALNPTASDVASAAQSLASAKAGLTTAQKSLDDLRAKPTSADLAAAQQSVLTAQNGVQSAIDARTKAQTDLTSAQADLGSADNDVDDAHSDLSFARKNLAQAEDDCKDSVSIPSLPSKGSQASTVQSLAFSFECAPDAMGADPLKTALGSYISAYNTSARDYNTALVALTTKQNAVTAAQGVLAGGNLERSIQNAQLGLTSAQQKYDETRAGAKPAEIEAATASLESAKASVAAAQARYDALFRRPTPDVLLPLQASVDQARATHEEAKKNLAAATIVAPFDGRISQVTGDVGTQVSATTSVFILLNPRLIRIDANVDQADVSALTVGQPATVTFDALAGRSYNATVSAVGLTPAVQQGVVTYVVTLAVDTGSLPANTPVPAPGMTASISVTTNRVDQALVVPSRAVRRSGRTSMLTVKTPSGDEQRTVTTGATNGTLIQVTSGLEEGDEVLVSAPRTTTTTTQTGGGGQGQQFFGPGGGGGAGGPPVQVR